MSTVNSFSVAAYDIPARVATYDADMDLMHPNRHKMLEVVLDLVPWGRETPFTALDLGVGTGFFTCAILQHFPNSRVIAIDGAASMIEMAKSRFGSLADRVDFRIGDFRDLSKLIAGGRGDLVYSAFALHHLSATDKSAVVRAALDFLKPGGWFLNADLIVAADSHIQTRYQDLRVEGIVRRAAGHDDRFQTEPSTRAFITDLEARDHDQPLTLSEDLRVLIEAGFPNASAFWLEYREAVTGGFKA
jgi:ubiquinone/menaquinone biosynthesis C-methylase UbiE